MGLLNQAKCSIRYVSGRSFPQLYKLMVIIKGSYVHCAAPVRSKADRSAVQRDWHRCVRTNSQTRALAVATAVT